MIEAFSNKDDEIKNNNKTFGISLLANYVDDPSSNRAEVYSSYYIKIVV